LTRTTIRSEDITAGQVKSADIASDAVDTTSLETDIALLGFKVAANGSMAAYNLKDQTVDAFEDATGVDASTSTNETRNASDYYSGHSTTAGATTAFTTVETTSWTAPSGVTSVNYLVVAGGGAGGGGQAGNYGGGGGGAGGLLTGTHTVVPSTSYTVTVGAGAVGRNLNIGLNGSNSVFDSFTATGGGGGGYAATSASDGGSGGGSGGTGPDLEGSGTTGQGNDGGGPEQYNAGGGGGKGGTGGSASSSSGGNGGAGYDATTVFGTSYGVSGFFAGGGGGGWNSYYGTDTPGSGGSGGGGAGGTNNNSAGNNGTANTGGGGGGGSSGTATETAGGSGGSGIVLVKYDEINNYNDMTLISNATTAESTPTTGDLVMTYTNGAGTATVNTDLKAWVSRDNGTTYTQATLSSQGTTGGHTILTAHNVDISSQPSGTSMRYKITTHNQSASKETRIQAVSLGWA